MRHQSWPPTFSHEIAGTLFQELMPIAWVVANKGNDRRQRDWAASEQDGCLQLRLQ